jgi:hypothetical protein
MAMMFQACAYREIGDYDKSKSILIQLINMDIPDEKAEKWGTTDHIINMNEKAAMFLKKYAEEFNDEEGLKITENFFKLNNSN